MISLHSGLTSLLTILSVLGATQATPLADKLSSLSPLARDVLKEATPAAPHFVAYNDLFLPSFPSAGQLRGFNVFALSFLLRSGAVDEAKKWETLPAGQRDSILKQYNAAGISLIVSAFGSTETPTTSNFDPVGTANTMAAWVKRFGVHGIDVDYEDLQSFNGPGGKAESWLITFTRQLRRNLPQGQFILTHAPVAPWFAPNRWSGGGYLAVNKQVGSLIDWVKGASEYTTCPGLLTASSSAWPQTALFQIAANGVSLNKLVIGKPATQPDATNGFMSPSTLASCASQARKRGWNGGVMVWQWPHATSSWISTVRDNTWPLAVASLLGDDSPSAPVSGNCDGVSEWSDSAEYDTDVMITYK
ncbi:glycoside hydrolase family 18 protein [Chiua virens]|nr:glycoside hydrolase family 18 protein [Chiua virens]